MGKFGSPELRADKTIVLSAVRNAPGALQFSKDWCQDPECLKAAGIWEEQLRVFERTEQAVLSLKFSLAEESSPYATDFAVAMRKDPFLGQFKTHNPNAWNKRSCDPKYTDMSPPCRGSQATCQIPEHENLAAATRKPCATSCWRVAFRFQQEECKSTNGFMVQVEEMAGLGGGQQIETEMAKQVGLKIFRAYTNSASTSFFRLLMEECLTPRVRAWYDSGCANMDLENIKFAFDKQL